MGANYVDWRSSPSRRTTRKYGEQLIAGAQTIPHHSDVTTIGDAADAGLDGDDLTIESLRIRVATTGAG
jgi:hypothetical protein